MLHHGGVAAFFQHEKLGVLDALVELLADEGRGHLVVLSPNEEGGGSDGL